jgi:hypothetical protein
VVVRVLSLVWAAPWSLVGLAVGGVDLIAGGRARRAGRILEFSGPVVRFVLARAPIVRGARAATFGHTVLARTMEDAEDARNHEMVHVRQYERWGPFFGPAYVISTVVQWARGKDPYYDNYFEREAFEEDARSKVTRLR